MDYSNFFGSTYSYDADIWQSVSYRCLQAIEYGKNSGQSFQPKPRFRSPARPTRWVAMEQKRRADFAFERLRWHYPVCTGQPGSGCRGVLFVLINAQKACLSATTTPD